jgi:tetratricopeptide (TPR) repeat protein
VRWYAPRLDAYTYALRRAQEIEADAFSAAAAGARNAAEALVVAAVLGAHLHESFWPAINRRPAQEPEPPVLHREMQLAFAGVPPATAHQHLTEALAEEADPFDSHPPLAERLAALGVPVPALPPRPTETAAERYLGDGLAELTATLDRDWSRGVRPSWREAHQEAREQRARLAELDERHGRGEALDDDDAFARADLVEDHRDPAEALALLRALVARNPHHPRASFALGRMLLARRDEAGIAHVERAMAHDPDAVTDGCQVIARYLRAVGRDAEAERYRERFEEADRAAEAARAARQGIDPGDRFAPHGLDEDDVASIVAQLRRIPGVKRAYLVRKELDDDGPPMFLLAFDRRRSLWRGLVMVSGGWWLLALLKDPTEKLRHRVAAGVQMPGESFVMALAPQHRATRERVRAVPGALILGTPTSEG